MDKPNGRNDVTPISLSSVKVDFCKFSLTCWVTGETERL